MWNKLKCFIVGHKLIPVKQISQTLQTYRRGVLIAEFNLGTSTVYYCKRCGKTVTR